MGRVDFSDVKHETRTFAGVTVPVSVVPRFKRQAYPTRFVFALKGLIEGMCLTFGYLVRPSRVVTRQYPENRATLRFPERYRASLKFKFDENGYQSCNGCGSCERACPNGSIILQTRKGEISGKNEIERYIWRMDSCVLCNACVEACAFGALEMSHDFENAVYDRRLLVYTLNRYAGPTAAVLLKEENPETRAAMMTKLDAYGGPVPMNGYALPTVSALGSPRAGAKPGEGGAAS
jgi:NADH-quinone oxidoreductase subunit I